MKDQPKCGLTLEDERKSREEDARWKAGQEAGETIRLLVTLNGAEGSVSVDQVTVDADNRITHAAMLVSGRSMGDVTKCLEVAALESQGRADPAVVQVIQIPRVYLQVGDKRNNLYPVYYCATGDNSGAVVVATIADTDEAYEIMCAACQAYNDLRNTERGE